MPNTPETDPTGLDMFTEKDIDLLHKSPFLKTFIHRYSNEYKDDFNQWLTDLEKASTPLRESLCETIGEMSFMVAQLSTLSVWKHQYLFKPELDPKIKQFVVESLLLFGYENPISYIEKFKYGITTVLGVWDIYHPDFDTDGTRQTMTYGAISATIITGHNLKALANANNPNPTAMLERYIADDPNLS